MVKKSPAEEAIVALARELYEKGALRVHQDAGIMVHEEVTIPHDLEPDEPGGAWVDASVWVPFDQILASGGPDVTLSLRWVLAVHQCSKRVRHALDEARDPDDLILTDEAAYKRNQSAASSLNHAVRRLGEWLDGKTTATIYDKGFELKKGKLRSGPIQEAIRVDVQNAVEEDPRLRLAGDDVLRTLEMVSKPTPVP